MYKYLTNSSKKNCVYKPVKEFFVAEKFFRNAWSCIANKILITYSSCSKTHFILLNFYKLFLSVLSSMKKFAHILVYKLVLFAYTVSGEGLITTQCWSEWNILIVILKVKINLVRCVLDEICNSIYKPKSEKYELNSKYNIPRISYHPSQFIQPKEIIKTIFIGNIYKTIKVVYAS